MVSPAYPSLRVWDESGALVVEKEDGFGQQIPVIDDTVAWVVDALVAVRGTLDTVEVIRSQQEFGLALEAQGIVALKTVLWTGQDQVRILKRLRPHLQRIWSHTLDCQWSNEYGRPFTITDRVDVIVNPNGLVPRNIVHIGVVFADLNIH